MPEVIYVGTCKGLIEKKNGWYAVEIAVPGKQYTYKADTKLEHLLTKAREIRDAGVVATWTVEEWDSENINPNSGKPYTERRLNGVEEGAAAQPQGGAQTSGPEPHHEAVHFADKDRLISRQVCLKVAGQIFMGKGFTEFEDSEHDVPLAVMKSAQRFELWLYRDIDPAPFRVSGEDPAPAEDSQPAENEQEADPRDTYEPPYPVDDIPF